MKLFWAAFDDRYDEVFQKVITVANQLPVLSNVMARASEAGLAAPPAETRKLLRAAVFDGEWDSLWQMHEEQGLTVAAMGVPFGELFELVSAFVTTMIPAILERYQGDNIVTCRALVGLNNYVDMTQSVIGEAYLNAKERIITEQQNAIQELSTPVLKIHERLLLVPLVGILDTQRARLMTEQLLRAIRVHRAKVVVIDITGVPAVDSKVANHLLQTVAAARLMGALSVITGLSADVAQALVVLGVNTEGLNTTGDLQGGLEEGLRRLGKHTVPIESAVPPRAVR